MARGMERPPTWAIVVMAACVVALAVMTPIALNRGTPPASASAGTPADPTPSVDLPQVAFLGDSYMAGSPMDSGEQARWPALVAQARGWDASMFAQGGTGYTTAGPQDGAARFLDRVPQVVDAAPGMVIVGGGANDAGADVKEFAASITEVLTALRSGLPDAELVVLSPFWRSAPPRQVLAMRDVIAEQAAAVDATFVDVSGIFADGVGVGADGVHPTDAGHARIADYLLSSLPAVG